MNDIYLRNVLKVEQRIGVRVNVNEEQIFINQAKLGDQQAFTELFHMHYTFLYRYIIKLTLDSYIADEIMQETMLKCYLRIGTFDGSSKFSSWMITIATRTYIDYLRKKKRERWLFKKAEVEAKSTIAWDVKMVDSQYEEVIEGMKNLDPLYRIPILLKHYYGFTYDEIGNMLKVKSGTVKSRVHKGIKVLRKELNEGG